MLLKKSQKQADIILLKADMANVLAFMQIIQASLITNGMMTMTLFTGSMKRSDSIAANAKVLPMLRHLITNVQNIFLC